MSDESDLVAGLQGETPTVTETPADAPEDGDAADDAGETGDAGGEDAADGQGAEDKAAKKPDGTEKYRGIARRAARAQKKVAARMAELRAEESRVGLSRQEREELAALRQVKELVGKSPREAARALGIDLNKLYEEILAADTPEERARLAARAEIEATEKARKEAEAKARDEHNRQAHAHAERAFIAQAADPKAYPFLDDILRTDSGKIDVEVLPTFLARGLSIGREIQAELQRMNRAEPGKGWDRDPTDEEILREYNAREQRRFERRRGAAAPGSTAADAQGGTPGESRAKARGGTRTLSNRAAGERTALPEPPTTREGTVSALAGAIRKMGIARR